MSGQDEQLGPDRSADPQCSAKGCRRSADWELLWNNPKLHQPERRKSWLACEEHRQSLSDFLGARRFLRDVVAMDRTETSGPAVDG